MQYTRLGNTSLSISRISLGCMSLPSDEQQAIRIIHSALAGGINFLDTADLYEKGANETILGKALKGSRHKYVIATKGGNQWNSAGDGWNWNPSKEHLIRAAEESLRRFDTDYIDLYQLHGGTIQDNFDEVISAFELLKAQGKIRYYGISSIRPNVIHSYIEKYPIASVMLQYSLLDRRAESSILNTLYSRHIGVLARGALAQGLLVNKAPKTYLSLSAQQVAAAASAVHSVSSPRRTPAQTAIRYVLHHPAITSTVVGARSIEQLDEIIEAIDTPGLGNEQYSSLQIAIPEITYTEHLT
jgi:aryl-alcohol dehydrogenase-like predicted oxidoreductase